MMKLNIFLPILFLTGMLHAESWRLAVSQKGDSLEPQDAGCELLTTVANTISASTQTGSLGLHWVMISSVAIASQTNYVVIADSDGTNTSELARVYVSTNSSMHKFEPPLQVRNSLFLSVSTVTIRASACFSMKNSTITRVAAPLDFEGKAIRARSAGCVPTRISFGSGSSAALISTTPSQGQPPASSANGTLVYWVSASSATTGISLFLRSTDTANTSSGLAVPGISVGPDVAPAAILPIDTMFRFDPPFRVLDRISYNLDTVGPTVTMCTRGIREY